MKVVFFHRKPAVGNFSIENVFQLIRNALPSRIDYVVHQMVHHSSGLLNRIMIGIEAAENQADVNHVTGDIHFATLFLNKKRTVLTIHDLGFLNHRNFLSRFILKLFWLDLAVANCRMVTTVSNATRLEILRKTKISPDKVKVIYNPISPSFRPLPKTFNKVEPVILQLGTKYNKNVFRLAEALAGIRCKLEIVGEVDHDLLRKLRAHNVKFESFRELTEEGIIERYKMADVVSFASTVEGFGLPIVEANAIGRVVVTSNCSSMPEIGGNAAHYIDPHQVESIRAGILKVINDDAYREDLIRKGLLNCKRFDLNVIASQYVEVYSSLLK